MTKNEVDIRKRMCKNTIGINGYTYQYKIKGKFLGVFNYKWKPVMTSMVQGDWTSKYDWPYVDCYNDIKNDNQVKLIVENYINWIYSQ